MIIYLSNTKSVLLWKSNDALKGLAETIINEKIGSLSYLFSLISVIDKSFQILFMKISLNLFLLLM